MRATVNLRENNPPWDKIERFAASLAYPANEQITEDAILQASDLFEGGFYLSKYPDVEKAAIDPFVHYIAYGFREMRQPAPWFDPAFYLAQNQDVIPENLNPFFHYLFQGFRQGRKPNDAPDLAAGRLIVILPGYGTAGFTKMVENILMQTVTPDKVLALVPKTADTAPLVHYLPFGLTICKIDPHNYEGFMNKAFRKDIKILWKDYARPDRLEEILRIWLAKPARDIFRAPINQNEFEGDPNGLK